MKREGSLVAVLSCRPQSASPAGQQGSIIVLRAGEQACAWWPSMASCAVSCTALPKRHRCVDGGFRAGSKMLSAGQASAAMLAP